MGSSAELFDGLAENYDSVMGRNGQHEVLHRHIKALAKGLDYSRVLDIGAGTGACIPAYLHKGVELVAAVEPSAGMRKALEAKFRGGAVKVSGEAAEGADFHKLLHGGKGQLLVVLALALPWLGDAKLVLKKACSEKPDYAIISEQFVDARQRKNIGRGHEKYAEIQRAYRQISRGEMDSEMAKHGYFPLAVLSDDVTDVNRGPAGKIVSTLYSRTKPDNEIYETAVAIFQVNNYCDKACLACYVTPARKMELGPVVFLRNIEALKKGDLISIRGGEPTLCKNWFARYVEPALLKDMRVVLETNGYFIGRDDYENTLAKLAHKNISVRISFDSQHTGWLNETARKKEFEKMARFAQDARRAGIKFGFYALGMGKKQIEKFIDGTPLEKYAKKFRSLTLYSDVSCVKLRGKYITADGRVHNCLV
ncbi:MAG: radical SAM protein [Candidatus Diapherotrites archaeon]